jgi:shikimate dehydrogenase
MALSGVKSLGIKGLNVTIPHKENIIKYLDNISDEAKAIGAVNTVKNVNGLTYGYNTDVYGFMKSLNENNIEYINKKVAILGFGGSAKAVVYGLVSEGIKELTIYVRNEKKARELSKNMEILSEIHYNVKSINNCEMDLGEVDLIINTTPLGMGNLKDKSPIDFRKSNFKQGLAVVDLIYNPIETVLIRDARELGYKSINGLDMLIYQGLKSFEIWTSQTPEKSIVEKSIIDYITK